VVFFHPDCEEILGHVVGRPSLHLFTRMSRAFLFLVGFFSLDI
jgi:hypothetical protein